MAENFEPFHKPYLQNRELSWLDFNERVLDQGSDPSVPLLERLNFVSIFSSNLQEFFMVRVGSLTDLSVVKKTIRDNKTGLTPAQQLEAIYARVHELYPIQETAFEQVRKELGKKNIHHLRPKDLTAKQRDFVMTYAEQNVIPFLSPQIINARHPFPHMENGALYVMVRLDEPGAAKDKKGKASAAQTRNVGAAGVNLGLIPLPHRSQRVIQLPGEGFNYILLEHVIEMAAPQVFNMYDVEDSNVICVTRNADIDATESAEDRYDVDYDYREFMKKVLKKRGRLAPVRLEVQKPIGSKLAENLLLTQLQLSPEQIYVTSVPMDMSYTWGLADLLPAKLIAKLVPEPFTPQWPAELDPEKPIMPQVKTKDVLLSYPYESMDPFVTLLREAANDPSVISIKITLYRLASQSHLAEALIAAAENGKEVTALFELRARFDESNNIAWSQRFEEAGCNVLYGFQQYKVHSKICCITRQTPDGIEYITQLGTGNYNEKTSKLYTDFSFLTCDEAYGKDAVRFFNNLSMETVSDEYRILCVAPLQIKPMICRMLDEQIKLAKAGQPCGAFFKTNSVTDLDVIEKIVKASQAGVPITMLVRGISCLVPGIKGYTENVKVVSIVGRLLEHSRIYAFGPKEQAHIYLSSADLMTRNMDKRVEIAWPVTDEACRDKVLDYISVCLADNVKLRRLKANTRYTALNKAERKGEAPHNAQEELIEQARTARASAIEEEAQNRAAARRAASSEDLTDTKGTPNTMKPKFFSRKKAADATEETAQVTVEIIEEPTLETKEAPAEPVTEEIEEAKPKHTFNLPEISPEFTGAALQAAEDAKKKVASGGADVSAAAAKAAQSLKERIAAKKAETPEIPAEGTAEEAPTETPAEAPAQPETTEVPQEAPAKKISAGSIAKGAAVALVCIGVGVGTAIALRFGRKPPQLPGK